ncbi:MAG: pyruvate kinase [bacterium]|nr:pyruvate kinase [bacterium]
MLIIASSGAFTAKKRNDTRMILAGADIIRINLSRHSMDKNLNLITDIKTTIDGLNANTKIMVDLPFNKYRLGDFEDKIFDVKEHEELICRSADYSTNCRDFIPLLAPTIGKKVTLDQIIAIGDGEIAVQVIEIINNEAIKIKILNTGTLVYHRTFNIPVDETEDESITSCADMLTKISPSEPDLIAVPYFSQSGNKKIKELAIWKNPHYNKTKRIIRIASPTAVADAETILSDPFYAMAMLDRGEMGINAPFEQIGIIQKQIIALAQKYQKPLLVSTQILESTVNNYIPSRAEILDLTDLTLNGIAGIVFCRETGLSSRPAYTISVARKIIKEAQKFLQRSK